MVRISASSEDLTPVQTLTKRYTRQLTAMDRLKSDDVLDKTLNAMMLDSMIRTAIISHLLMRWS